MPKKATKKTSAKARANKNTSTYMERRGRRYRIERDENGKFSKFLPYRSKN